MSNNIPAQLNSNGARLYPYQFLGKVDDDKMVELLKDLKDNYTWPKDEKHNYEIDFLLSHGAKLWPLEVKSSGYKTHASIDAFCTKYSSRVDKRFLIYTKDYAQDEATILLPAYMVPVMG